MVVERIEVIQREAGGSCRQALEAVGLPRATFHRWRARLRSGEPPVQRPGPKKTVPLDLENLLTEVRQLKHRRRRSFGTRALYEAHREAISRRELQKLVKAERSRLKAEKHANMRRITWQVPGLTWAIDGTRIGKADLQQMQDLASRYKFEPLLAKPASDEQVAEYLERIIAVHGPPLILKRDRGSNLQGQAVQAVLEKHLIIPLDSPRQYPPYNGAIEHAQGELKGVLATPAPGAEQAPLRPDAAAHELNHRPRPCLGGRTACAVFEAGRAAMKAYTRPRRKQIILWIQSKALDIIRRSGLSGVAAQDAAWRRAVESWLHWSGVITVARGGKLLPCFN
jgi:transposase InsO family protein